MDAVRSLRDLTGLTQAEMADATGTSQPAIAAYETGRRSPTLRTLARMASAVGYEVHVAYHPPMTREDRRSLAVHRAIAAHLREEPESVLRRARRTLAKMTRVASSSRAIKEWRILLDCPLDAIEGAMLDPSPWGRELRHVTPFAGILPARERAEVIRSFANEWREAS